MVLWEFFFIYRKLRCFLSFLLYEQALADEARARYEKATFKVVDLVVISLVFRRDYLSSFGYFVESWLLY